MKYIIDLPDDWRPPKPKDCPTSCPWFEWDGEDCNVYCHPAKCPLANAISLRDEERKQGDGLVKELEDALRHGFKGDNNGGLFFMPSWFENKIWDVLSRHAAKEPTK